MLIHSFWNVANFKLAYWEAVLKQFGAEPWKPMQAGAQALASVISHVMTGVFSEATLRSTQQAAAEFVGFEAKLAACSGLTSGDSHLSFLSLAAIATDYENHGQLLVRESIGEVCKQKLISSAMFTM